MLDYARDRLVRAMLLSGHGAREPAAACDLVIASTARRPPRFRRLGLFEHLQALFGDNDRPP